MKLEVLDTWTDWSVAPEDIYGLASRMTNAESNIMQNANNIALRVTTSTYNTEKVYRGSSAPSTLYTNMLWLDTSVSPNLLKRYTGSAWVVAGAQEVKSSGIYIGSNNVAITTENFLLQLLDPSNNENVLMEMSANGNVGFKELYAENVVSNSVAAAYDGPEILYVNPSYRGTSGEVPQYYVENSHPAIVTEEVFDLVQHELRRRQEQGRHTSAVSIFSSRIICGECGAYYGSKFWHSTDAYRLRIWQCNRKYETNGSPCPSPHLREEELQTAFLKAINQVLERKEEIIEACTQVLGTLNDTTLLEQKAERLRAEQDAVNSRIERLIRENAQVAQDQQEYKLRIEALYARCEELQSGIAKVRSQTMDRAGRSRSIEAYLQRIGRTELLTEFDESVFIGTVDCVIVCKGQGKNERKLIFRFKDGTEIPMTM